MDDWQDWSTNPPPAGVLIQVQRETAGMPEQPWTTRAEELPRGTTTWNLRWRLTGIAKHEEPSF